MQKNQMLNRLAALVLSCCAYGAALPALAQEQPQVGIQKVAEPTAGLQVEVLPRSSWAAKPATPYKKQYPNRITIHHEGGKVIGLDQDAAQRLRNIQSWCMGPDRKWADIPYHFLIAPDGTVYAGRDVFTVGESNTPYDPTGHIHISFLGNYTEQKLNSKLLQVLTGLVADLCKTYGISPTTIAGHRDYYAQTSCPSEEIYQHLQDGSLLKSVEAQLEKH